MLGSFVAAVCAALISVAAQAQTAPPVDPHAGHVAGTPLPATKPATDPHAGHDMSGMPPTARPGMNRSAEQEGTALKSSSPADGATVSPPREISLTLPHAMTIQSITLTNASNQRVLLNATLPATPTEIVSVPVPALTPGAYRVTWKAVPATTRCAAPSASSCDSHIGA